MLQSNPTTKGPPAPRSGRPSTPLSVRTATIVARDRTRHVWRTRLHLMPRERMERAERALKLALSECARDHAKAFGPALNPWFPHFEPGDQADLDLLWGHRLAPLRTEYWAACLAMRDWTTHQRHRL